MNNADTRAKGRARVPRGADVKGARLTEPDVQIIRVLYGIGCTYQEVAIRYGVGLTTIRHVTQRKTWAHVPDYDLEATS